MPRDARALLHDRLDACEQVLAFIGDRQEADYAKDALLKSAVERKLMIIG